MKERNYRIRANGKMETTLRATVASVSGLFLLVLLPAGVQVDAFNSMSYDLQRVELPAGTTTTMMTRTKKKSKTTICLLATTETRPRTYASGGSMDENNDFLEARIMELANTHEMDYRALEERILAAAKAQADYNSVMNALTNKDPVLEGPRPVGAVARMVGRSALDTIDAMKPKAKAIAKAALENAHYNSGAAGIPPPQSYYSVPPPPPPLQQNSRNDWDGHYNPSPRRPPYSSPTGGWNSKEMFAVSDGGEVKHSVASSQGGFIGRQQQQHPSYQEQQAMTRGLERRMEQERNELERQLFEAYPLPPPIPNHHPYGPIPGGPSLHERQATVQGAGIHNMHQPQQERQQPEPSPRGRNTPGEPSFANALDRAKQHQPTPPLDLQEQQAMARGLERHIEQEQFKSQQSQHQQGHAAYKNQNAPRTSLAKQAETPVQLSPPEHQPSLHEQQAMARGLGQRFEREQLKQEQQTAPQNAEPDVPISVENKTPPVPEPTLHERQAMARGQQMRLSEQERGEQLDQIAFQQQSMAPSSTAHNNNNNLAADATAHGFPQPAQPTEDNEFAVPHCVTKQLADSSSHVKKLVQPKKIVIQHAHVVSRSEKVKLTPEPDQGSKPSKTTTAAQYTYVVPRSEKAKLAPDPGQESNIAAARFVSKSRSSPEVYFRNRVLDDELSPMSQVTSSNMQASKVSAPHIIHKTKQQPNDSGDKPTATPAGPRIFQARQRHAPQAAPVSMGWKEQRPGVTTTLKKDPNEYNDSEMEAAARGRQTGHPPANPSPAVQEGRHHEPQHTISSRGQKPGVTTTFKRNPADYNVNEVEAAARGRQVRTFDTESDVAPKHFPPPPQQQQYVTVAGQTSQINIPGPRSEQTQSRWSRAEEARRKIQEAKLAADNLRAGAARVAAESSKAEELWLAAEAKLEDEARKRHAERKLEDERLKAAATKASEEEAERKKERERLAAGSAQLRALQEQLERVQAERKAAENDAQSKMEQLQQETEAKKLRQFEEQLAAEKAAAEAEKSLLKAEIEKAHESLENERRLAREALGEKKRLENLLEETKKVEERLKADAQEKEAKLRTEINAKTHRLAEGRNLAETKVMEESFARAAAEKAASEARRILGHETEQRKNLENKLQAQSEKANAATKALVARELENAKDHRTAQEKLEALARDRAEERRQLQQALEIERKKVQEAVESAAKERAQVRAEEVARLSEAAAKAKEELKVAAKERAEALAAEEARLAAAEKKLAEEAERARLAEMARKDVEARLTEAAANAKEELERAVKERAEALAAKEARLAAAEKKLAEEAERARLAETARKDVEARLSEAAAKAKEELEAAVKEREKAVEAEEARLACAEKKIAEEAKRAKLAEMARKDVEERARLAEISRKEKDRLLAQIEEKARLQAAQAEEALENERRTALELLKEERRLAQEALAAERRHAEEERKLLEEMYMSRLEEEKKIEEMLAERIRSAEEAERIARLDTLKVKEELLKAKEAETSRLEKNRVEKEKLEAERKRLAEEARLAEEQRVAEEARLAAEERIRLEQKEEEERELAMVDIKPSEDEWFGAHRPEFAQSESLWGGTRLRREKSYISRYAKDLTQPTSHPKQSSGLTEKEREVLARKIRTRLDRDNADREANGVTDVEHSALMKMEALDKMASEHTLSELHGLARGLGLSVEGTKVELLERLMDSDAFRMLPTVPTNDRNVNAAVGACAETTESPISHDVPTRSENKASEMLREKKRKEAIAADYTLYELQGLARGTGLSTRGSKMELLDRLLEHDIIKTPRARC